MPSGLCKLEELQTSEEPGITIGVSRSIHDKAVPVDPASESSTKKKSKALKSCSRHRKRRATESVSEWSELTIGRLTAMCKLVALWKDENKTDVRPIGIRGALRRLLVKAYSNQIKIQLRLIVQDHQLRVLKAGYENWNSQHEGTFITLSSNRGSCLDPEPQERFQHNRLESDVKICSFAPTRNDKTCKMALLE